MALLEVSNVSKQFGGLAAVSNVDFHVIEGAHHDIHDFEKEWIYDLEAEFLKDKMGVK